MRLGQRIYELRVTKRLSQSSLAELLDVSRQSVSKWETDTAIPDLDKLIKMCDLFEVTLDELTGRTKADINDTECTAENVEKDNASNTSVKIIGYILLATTIISCVLLSIFAEDDNSFYFSMMILPSTLICSIICLCAKNDVGYWCTWTVLAPVAILSKNVFGLPILSALSCVTAIIYTIMTLFAIKKLKIRIVNTNKFITITLYITVPLFFIAQIIILKFFPTFSVTRIIIDYILYAISAVLLTYCVNYIKVLKK